MNRIVVGALLLSGVIHTLIALWFLMSPPLSLRSLEPPLTVEIVERKKGDPKKLKGPSGRKSVSLARLRPRFKIYPNSTEWQDEHWGKGGGDLGEVAHFLKYDRIREDLRGMLNYPYVFSQREIQGTINARLAFTENSNCDWKRIRIDGNDRHLRIYILTLLKKLCSFEVVHALKATRKDFLDVSFQFAIINEFTPYSLQKDSDTIVGNVISFRKTSPDSVFVYQIGPIRGVWFAPAVSLDFDWLMEKWDQYVEGIDPMAPFKE